MITTKTEQYIIATTRFNNTTYEEYRTYHEKNSIKGCVYNTPVQITSKISLYSNLFIIEMNNSVNQIMGIGYITNDVRHTKYRIYSDQNYNRYSYSGNYRFGREILLRHFKETIEKIETLLFYGSGHLKRGSGILRLPQKKLNKDKEFTKEILIMIMILKERFMKDTTKKTTLQKIK
jgi:hypothetical protein